MLSITFITCLKHGFYVKHHIYSQCLISYLFCQISFSPLPLVFFFCSYFQSLFFLSSRNFTENMLKFLTSKVKTSNIASKIFIVAGVTRKNVTRIKRMNWNKTKSKRNPESAKSVQSVWSACAESALWK